MKLIISCEHAKNRVPTKYRQLFNSHEKLLTTHLGYDINILPIAKFLARDADFFIYGEFSRLLIDLNRSLNNKQLFSNISRDVNKNIKDDILRNYYLPYRNKLIAIIDKMSINNRILHLSCHSFTPILHHKKRAADVGLLYAPTRLTEKNFCALLQQEIKNHGTKLRIRRNYPYQGTSDGITSFLRKRYSKNRYLGIELELNQNLLKNADERKKVSHILQASLNKAIAALGD